MARVIAIANQKGGVGKTTTAVNLAYGFYLYEYSTLLIDLDQQANATDASGLESDDYEERSIYHVLCEDTPIKDVIVETTNGYDVLPSHIEFAGAEMTLSQVMSREFQLRRAITPIHDKYEYIIIDCPPALNYITINAFAVATDVVICMRPDRFSSLGLRRLLQTLAGVRDKLGNKPMVFALFCAVDMRQTVDQELITSMHEEWKGNFLDPIRKSVTVTRALMHKMSVVEYSPKSPVTGDYILNVQRLISHDQNTKQIQVIQGKGQGEAGPGRKTTRA